MTRSRRLIVHSVLPTANPNKLQIDATLDDESVVINAQFTPVRFGDQDGWMISFDGPYWDIFTGEYTPDPEQFRLLVSHAYHGDQIAFPVEIAPKQ